MSDKKIDKEQLLHLAHLARLKFSEQELEQLQGDMGKMLAFVSAIDKLDLDGIEPLVHLTENKNRFRNPETSSLSKEELLKNAPESNDGFFIVPKVID